MKTVFNNRELAHVWAQQNQDRGKGSNMFFEGTSIYSYGYHFKMAEFIEAPNGEKVLMFNSATYSMSTGKQQSYVRRAIWDNAKIVYCITNNYSGWDFAGELDKRINEISDLIDSAAKGQEKSREWKLSQAISAIKQLPEFAAMFNLEMPAIYYTWNVDELLSPEKIAAVKARVKAVKQAEREKHNQEIAEWLNHERYSVSTNGKIYIRISGEVVETSSGAKVPVKEAELLYKRIATGKDVVGAKIGYYTVRSWNGQELIIGCHNIDKGEVDRFAGLMRWN